MNWNVCARDEALGSSSQYQESKRGYNADCGKNEYAYGPSGVPRFCEPAAEVQCIDGYHRWGYHQNQDCAKSHFAPPYKSAESSWAKAVVT